MNSRLGPSWLFVRIGLALAAAALLVARTANAQPTLTSLHSFLGGGAVHPMTALVQAADGNFYGTSRGGPYSDSDGLANHGAVFKMTAGGDFTVLHFFAGAPDDGSSPSALIQATDGNFYGTTFSGGASDWGTVFTMNPDGAVTVLYSFSGTGPDRGNPAAALFQGADGNFYGTTSYNGGTVFKVTPAGTLTTLHSFSGADGASPRCALILGSDGYLYGTTIGGSISGTAYPGNVFKMTFAGVLTVLYSTSLAGGVFQPTSVIQAIDGNFYVTQRDGPFIPPEVFGSVLKMTPTGVVTRVTSTISPIAGPLLQASDGNLYGMTTGPGPNFGGDIFRLTLGGTLTHLHSFAGGAGGTDGATPLAGLIQATDGSFYGTTSNGGAPDPAMGMVGGGTVFQMTGAGAVTTLHAFSLGTSEGAAPTAIVQARDSNFYGTTSMGGASDLGTIYKVTPTGTLTVLHSFAGPPTDGASPRGGLLEGADGNFYGTAGSVIFTITPTGTYSVLHVFAGGPSDGSGAVAPLIQGRDGNFYGTTESGGAFNSGTVFSVTPAGVVTVLYSFTGTLDGGRPRAALLQAGDGNFYGMTTVGGSVFKMTPAGGVTILTSFGSQAFQQSLAVPARASHGALIQANDGNFYGTTDSTVFRMTPAGAVTGLFELEGLLPYSGVIQAADGNFYGTAYSAGAGTSPQIGTIFRLTPTGAVTTLHAFSLNLTDGALPLAGLRQAPGGDLYGTTGSGGGYGAGLVFRLHIPCTYTLVPTGTTFGALGGTGSVTVSTQTGCPWTVTNVPLWASTSGDNSGVGPGTWQFAVDANAGAARGQTVTIATETFALGQLAVGVTPATITTGAGAAFTLTDDAAANLAAAETVGGRSYCAELAPAATATDAAAPHITVLRADTTTVLAAVDGSGRACFVAPATETTFIRITQSDGSARQYRLRFRESTLWANWFFTGGTYSSYTLLRNTTAGPVDALITWRGDRGAILRTLYVTIPAGAVAYYDARVTTTGGVIAGSLDVAHTGEPQALVGSQTTLSAVTGLTVESPLKERATW